MEKDIEAIIKSAKEVMTRYGSHPPTLFVKGEQGGVYTKFLDFGPEHEDRVRQVANRGVSVACEQNVGELKYLIFVAEGWMGTAKKGQPYIQPSKDPKRKEVLQIVTLDVPSNKQGIIMYHMIRDQWGRLIEISRLPETWDAVEGPILPAFVAGYNLITR